MRGPLKYLALLILVPFLACTDTPTEPEAEETTASFKAERPPDFGDWLVVNVKCSGRYACFATVQPYPTVPGVYGYDCQHYTAPSCDYYPPYIETPAATFHWQVVAGEGGQVCVRNGTSDVSVLDSGPLTRYCLLGDKVVAEATYTRVIND